MGAAILSARTTSPGGPVAPQVRVAQGALGNPSRLTLLVHGYNNTEAEALAGYAAFLADSGLNGALAAGQVCGFVWPGDKAWGLFAPLAYPLELEPARESAARLYAFLEALPTAGGWPLEVRLVCHSLGNRLLLELLACHLAAGRPPSLRFEACCLMAAAVPVHMVEAGGTLRAAAEAPAKTLVLHSSADAVLHWAFPVGQSAAGEGFFPTAVGRYGDPGAELWTERKRMEGYGHGSYWPGAESAAAVAGFLGGAPARTLPAAELAPHVLPDAPPVSERSLTSRQLPEKTKG